MSAHFIQKNKILAVLLLGLLSAISALAESSKLTAPTKIGFILPLSGEYAQFGNGVREGLELAAKENKGAPIEMYFEDGGTMTSRDSLSAARKLLDVSKVDVLSTMIVDDAEPIGPVAEKSNIPLVVLWDSSERVKASGKTVFTLGYTSEDTGRMLAAAAVADGRKRIAVIIDDSPWVAVITDYFKQEVEKRGAVMVSSIDAKEGMASVVTKLRATRPESVFLAFNLPGMIIDFLKQAKTQKFKAQYLTGEPLVGEGMTAAGELAEGVFLSWIDYSNQPHAASDPLTAGTSSVGYNGFRSIADIAARSESTLMQRFHAALGASRALPKKPAIYQVEQGKLKGPLTFP